MRLIDADELKKVLSEPLYRSTIKDFGEVLEYTHIMNTIDNAPTVEPYNKDETYIRGYDDGFKDALRESKKGSDIF